MTKVEPSVEKGRSPEVSMTGGAPIPPRAPAKVWTFVPEVAVAAEAVAAAAATAAAAVVAPAPIPVETARHAPVAAAAVADAVTTGALVVTTAGAVEEAPETPRAALKASAAA